jgi:peptide/nickel transport system ATP-binding protein
MSAPLLEVRGLRVAFDRDTGFFRRGGRPVVAVDGVDLEVRRGETLGIVGESGSGKTTIGRAIVRALAPSAGEIRFDGTDIAKMSFAELLPFRARFQMVFQDPYSSLDPRRTIGESLEEPLQIHRIASGAAARLLVADLLQTVGLPAGAAGRRPAQFSGGQLQRIGVARALAVNPELIVCDEPVSALDVSIQAQIVNLLKRLQTQLRLAYVFIAHDLAVVRHIADRVSVVYLGRIVEEAPTDALFDGARHPYTLALLSAVPIPDVRRERMRRPLLLRGDPPSPAATHHGCRFVTRCWLYERLQRPENCLSEDPSLRPLAVESHRVACHHSRHSRAEAARHVNAEEAVS